MSDEKPKVTSRWMGILALSALIERTSLPEEYTENPFFEASCAFLLDKYLRKSSEKEVCA